MDLAARVIPQIVLDDEQDRARQHRGGEDEGEKKPGSQSNLGHDPIVFSAPRRPGPAAPASGAAGLLKPQTCSRLHEQS